LRRPHLRARARARRRARHARGADGARRALRGAVHAPGGAVPRGTMSPRGTPVPPFVMDRPVLHAIVRELVDTERLAEFGDALPTRARISESALPPVLATLHERLQQPLVVLLPEDADARDTAEAAGWYLGEENVGYLPSRGVRWESGLEPPPHLVGER